jgi:hypothetical protein
VTEAPLAAGPAQVLQMYRDGIIDLQTVEKLIEQGWVA